MAESKRHLKRRTSRRIEVYTKQRNMKNNNGPQATTVAVKPRRTAAVKQRLREKAWKAANPDWDKPTPAKISTPHELRKGFWQRLWASLRRVLRRTPVVAFLLFSFSATAQIGDWTFTANCGYSLYSDWDYNGDEVLVTYTMTTFTGFPGVILRYDQDGLQEGLLVSDVDTQATMEGYELLTFWGQDLKSGEINIYNVEKDVGTHKVTVVRNILGSLWQEMTIYKNCND